MPKQLIYILLSFLLQACIPSYDSRLLEAEALMSERPDSALTLIEAMGADDFHDPDSQALHALLLTQARSENHIEETDISPVTTAINRFKASGDRYHLMLALHYSGKLLYRNHNYSSSLHDLTQSMDIATELDDKFWIAKSASLISGIYSDSHHHSEAIDFGKTALRNFKLAKRQPYINHAMLDLAKSYLDAKLHQPTLHLSKQLIDSAEKYNDPHLKSEAIRLMSLTRPNKMESRTDSMLREMEAQNLSRVRSAFYNDKNQANKAKLRTSKNTNISILCLSLLIVSIISLLSLRHRRKQQAIIEHNIQVAQNLKEIIRVKDEHSQSTIHALLADRFEILDNLCKILYENPSNLARKRVSTEIDNIVVRFSKDPSMLATLEEHINLHHDNILIHLKQDMPGIKDADYRIMVYSLLGFSNSAIALFLGEEKITAVYDRRKRLKTKLKNLDSKHSAAYLKALS